MSDGSDPRADASEHRADLSETRADVSEKRADVSEKRADVSELRQDASDVRQDDRVLDIDERLAAMSDDNRALGAALAAVERAVIDDRRSRERRIKWLRWVFVVSLAVGLFGVFVGLWARAGVRDVVAARRESRIGACLQDNIRIDQHNDLVDATKALQGELDAILAFSTSVPDGVVLTDEQKARRAAFLKLVAEQKAKVDTALASTFVDRRDCSAAGVDAYLSTTSTTAP